jgi:GntR family transcriptional regulator/MocR family aminotransferase
VYKSRREALIEGLAKHCAEELIVHNADAGLHIATLLARGQSDADALERMKRHGLTGVTLSSCYIGPKPRQGLLLGFGCSDERQLATATRTLGEALRGR